MQDTQHTSRIPGFYDLSAKERLAVVAAFADLTADEAEALQGNGYQVTEAGAADLYIVNTCAVTHEAEGKARRLIRRLLRDRPRYGVLVLGCFVSRDPEALRGLGAQVRVVADKERLPEILAECGVRAWPRGISHFHGHQRAFVKVQDGCLLNCTFCIIPYVRPRFGSRPVAEIVHEVERLVANGYREIVLTGIHLGHYGIDLSRGKPKEQWSRLWHLLDRLAELPGEFRIRLSSLEAAEVRADLLEACRRNPRICPHFHVCLQSGSNRILQAMRRRYRVESFVKNCEMLRQAFDNPAILHIQTRHDFDRFHSFPPSFGIICQNRSGGKGEMAAFGFF